MNQTNSLKSLTKHHKFFYAVGRNILGNITRDTVICKTLYVKTYKFEQ